MIFPVRNTPEADAQIRTIDDWWRENRSSAPDLFLDELAACIHVIGHTPQIGRLYRQSPAPGTRRILLKSSRLVLIGEARLRRTLTEFGAHYHGERNHQGIQNRLIAPEPTGPPGATVRCRSQLGGLLRYYHRAA